MKLRLEDAIRSGRLALRSAYPAAVTALAAALLVLLLWPRQERMFVAEAMVSAQSAGEFPPLAEAEAWLLSDEVLRAAIASVRSSHPRELADSLPVSAGEPSLTLLREAVELVPLASPDETPRLVIGCRWPQRRAALAIADGLARQLAEHHPAHVRRSRLLSQEERERTAKAELEAAQRAQERLEVELQGLRHAHLASAVAAAPTPPTAARTEPTPPASELARTLESLRLERDRLLEIYLPAHPQIQTLSAQISRLEESLRRSTTKSDLHGAAQPVANSSAARTVLLEWRREGHASAAPASGAEVLTPSADARTELAAAIRQTQLDLLAATQRRQEAEHAWQVLAGERKRIDADSELLWQIEPGRILSSGGSSRSQLASALVAAAVGGVGIGWLATRRQQLATAAEVRTALGMPVIATLSSGRNDPAPGDSPDRSQAVVQWTTRCAEVVLATFVLTLLAAIALDRGLVADLAHDPLATLGELVERLI